MWALYVCNASSRDSLFVFQRFHFTLDEILRRTVLLLFFYTYRCNRISSRSTLPASLFTTFFDQLALFTRLFLHISFTPTLTREPHLFRHRLSERFPNAFRCFLQLEASFTPNSARHDSCRLPVTGVVRLLPQTMPKLSLRITFFGAIRDVRWLRHPWIVFCFFFTTSWCPSFR